MDGNTYQMRQLADGRSYEVLKNFPTRTELEHSLASVSVDVAVTELGYFWAVYAKFR
jgi:hypothetical protein